MRGRLLRTAAVVGTAKVTANAIDDRHDEIGRAHV